MGPVVLAFGGKVTNPIPFSRGACIAGTYRTAARTRAARITPAHTLASAPLFQAKRPRQPTMPSAALHVACSRQDKEPFLLCIACGAGCIVGTRDQFEMHAVVQDKSNVPFRLS